jgi:hypothetical protein
LSYTSAGALAVLESFRQHYGLKDEVPALQLISLTHLLQLHSWLIAPTPPAHTGSARDALPHTSPRKYIFNVTSGILACIAQAHKTFFLSDFSVSRPMCGLLLQSHSSCASTVLFLSSSSFFFLSFFLFFLWALGWNSGLCVYKAGILLLEPHPKSIFLYLFIYFSMLWLFWRWSLMNYLPRLALNHNPSDLSLPNS